MCRAFWYSGCAPNILDRYDELSEQAASLRAQLLAVEEERRELRAKLDRAIDRGESRNGTAPLAAVTSAGDAITETVKAVRVMGGRADAAMVSDFMKIARGIVRTRLSRAVDAGLLERRERGVYVVLGFPKEETKGEEGAG